MKGLTDIWRYWPWYLFCAAIGTGFAVDAALKDRAQAMVVIGIWSSIAAGLAFTGQRRTRERNRESDHRQMWRSASYFFLANATLSFLLLFVSIASHPSLK